MDKFEPPSCLRFEGNLNENWQKWRQELELYLTATEKDGKSDKIKTSILLTCVGKQGREIYNTFQFVEGEEMKFKVVVGYKCFKITVVQERILHLCATNYLHVSREMVNLLMSSLLS